jgi:hypothetical protein
MALALALLSIGACSGSTNSNNNPSISGDEFLIPENAPVQTSTVSPGNPSTAFAPTPGAQPTETLPLNRIIGPEYLPGYHPLTGLPIRNPSALTRNPLLVSITNFPPSARPQAGLSFASQVWETSIGQGMTRFLALYYGEYLQALYDLAGDGQGNNTYEYVLGPIRSGRIAFEEIKNLFPGSKMIIRYASYQVVPRLSNIVVVDPADPDDVNSAGLTLEELDSLTQDQVNPEDYAGMTFNHLVPTNGQPGKKVEIIYNVLNRVRWDYDPRSGAYLRFQSEPTEGGAYRPAIDRLTGEQLSFENVLILFAEHRFENLAASIIDIKLSYVANHYGFLLRDGNLYPIKWSTTHSRLLLEDYDGNGIPFKPGKTFVQVVSYETSYDREQLVFRFHNPKLPTFTPVTPVSSTPTLTETIQPSSTPTSSPIAEGTGTPTASPSPTFTGTPSPSQSSSP